MKIISETKEGYLVDMSKHDICRIINKQAYSTTIRLGDELNVAAIYRQAVRLPDLLNSITEAQIKLREVANTIEPIKPVIKEVIGMDDK